MYAMSLSPSDISHSVTAGNTTSQFIVQRQNGYANTVTSGWNNIYLQTTSPTGKFYYINGSLITPYTPSNNHQVRDALPSILLRDGYGGLRFRYSDTTSGNWTITAWSDGTCPYVPSGFNSSYSMTNITYPDGTFGLKYSIGQPVQSASTTIHVLPIAQSVGISARVQFNSTQFTNYLLPQKYNITIQLNNNGYIPVDDGLNNTILDGNVFVEMTAMSEFWFSNGTTYTPWQNIEFYSPPNMFFPEMYINQTIYTSLGFPLVLDGNWHDGFNAPCYYIPPTLSAGVQLTKVTFSFKLTVYSEVTWLGETSSSSGDGIDLGMYMILSGYGPTLGSFTSESIYQAPTPTPTPTPSPTSTPTPTVTPTVNPTQSPTVNPTISPTTQPINPTSNPTVLPTPTPSIPELSIAIILPMIALLLSCAVAVKLKKANK
jgi:hypothetical protein